MIDRRAFLTGSAALLAAPLAAEAQQAGKVSRIGLLNVAASDSASAARWKAFRERLRELGYVEGQNVIFESRWGDGQVGHLRSLAAELIEELAEKAGLSREYIRLLEAGIYDPTVGTMQRLAKALGVPVTELLG